MVRRSDQDAALEALYARVPKVDCKGKCTPTCGSITISTRERQRAREAGVTIRSKQEMTARREYDCAALVEGRCTIYSVRPMVCRLWGASEVIPCRFGCRPEPGSQLLGAAETYWLVIAAMQAGGTTDKDIAAFTEADVYAKERELGKAEFRRFARAWFAQTDVIDYARKEKGVSPALAGQALFGKVAGALTERLAEDERLHKYGR